MSETRLPVHHRGEIVGWALVSDEDAEELSATRWSVNRDGYAYGRPGLMHRVVVGCTIGDGLIVDHRNGNRLDNRRSNLRPGTAQDNARNSLLWRINPTWKDLMGHSNWRDVKHKRPLPISLSELRKQRGVSQDKLADTIGCTQPAISQIERSGDKMVSTMRSYVEALGGHLEITAVFPDGAVPIRTFEELEERELEPA